MKIAITGDAVTMPTSYGKTGFKLLSALKKRGHEVSNLAIQHVGAPIEYNGIQIYQATDEATFAKALTLTKPDVVIELRDAWVHTRYYQKPYHLWPACREAGVIFTQYSPIQSAPLPQEYINTVWEESDYFITMTRWGMEKLIEQGAPAERLAYLYHGIDPSVFHFLEQRPPRSMFGLPESGRMVTFVGLNQDFRKLQPLLMYAFREYLKGDPDAFLYLHTDWGGAYDIAQHIRALGLAGKRKVFLRPATGMGSSMWGFTDEQMNLLYGMSDIYCSLTASEGFNMPALEAISTGLPTVLTHTPVHEELFKELGAYLVPSRKIYPNAWGMEWFSDPDMAAEMMHRAAERGRRKIDIPPYFLWDNIAVRLEEMLKSWL